MINEKIIKLKKYLLLISILFFVLSLTHLIYIYLYNDSKLVAIKGGTISEGLIGDFPSLNPLKPLSGNNKYIVELLYRSLLKYDSEQGKISSDIASCDISNLLNIECYIEDNIYWSNGKPITTEDIVATYKLLQTTGVNKIASSLLEGTKIEERDNTILFINEKKDINFLNIFFQPILSKEIIDSLGKDTLFGNFPTIEQIYSGDFIIGSITSDYTIGITKIFLERNPFNNKGNISKLIIKLFPNTNSFLQNRESINIFNDNDNLIGESIPRLKSYKYTLPQYVSVFLNQNNIKDLDLRNFIFSKINENNLVKLLGEDNFKVIKNPYLTEISINNEINNKSFEKILSNKGYFKKSKIIEDYLPNSDNKVYSQEAEIEIKEDNLSIGKFQEESKYIRNPTYVEKYNFITKDDILLEGISNKDVDSIYINDYKLSNYQKGNTKFYYRLKETFNSIKEGENTYRIYFEQNGNKILKEEVNFIYYKNKTTLDKKTKEFIKKLYVNELRETQKKVEKVVISKDNLEKLSILNDKLYYNDALESFTLNLYYISSDKYLEETAYFIKNSLLEIGIEIELFPISIQNLAQLLSEKDTYDILLTGVNLGYFNYNIFPYFHSSQAKNGYNFSGIKKTSLDILLEELKSNILTTEEKEKLEKKILDILKKEQVIKTLYTPKINLLIDKNINNVTMSNYMVNKEIRKNLLNDIYIKEEKIINFSNKGIMDFFNFLYKKLND